jgi:uncharacterized protein (DUF1330 family)
MNWRNPKAEFVTVGRPSATHNRGHEIGPRPLKLDVTVNVHTETVQAMAKAYWIAVYRSIRDQEAFAAYARLASPALQAAGGRFLARGLPARVYENGLEERAVLLEFDSVAQATAAHDSPGYRQALRALGNAADRDIRIVEGVE